MIRRWRRKSRQVDEVYHADNRTTIFRLFFLLLYSPVHIFGQLGRVTPTTVDVTYIRQLPNPVMKLFCVDEMCLCFALQELFCTTTPSADDNRPLAVVVYHEYSVYFLCHWSGGRMYQWQSHRQWHAEHFITYSCNALLILRRHPERVNIT